MPMPARFLSSPAARILPIVLPVCGIVAVWVALAANEPAPGVMPMPAAVKSVAVIADSDNDGTGPAWAWRRSSRP